MKAFSIKEIIKFKFLLLTSVEQSTKTALSLYRAQIAIQNIYKDIVDVEQKIFKEKGFLEYFGDSSTLSEDTPLEIKMDIVNTLKALNDEEFKVELPLISFEEWHSICKENKDLIGTNALTSLLEEVFWKE